MAKNCYLLLLLVQLSLSTLSAQSPEQVIQRVHAFLILEDPHAALSEIQEGLRQNPKSSALQRTEIQVLASLGDSNGMINAWKRYAATYPESAEDRELMEMMAWGIISKGARSQALVTRAVALVGAYLGNDSRGVALLAESLHSNNCLIRALTVEIASKMRDQTLRETIAAMLNQEPVWAVRLAVMQAVGDMQIVEAAPDLEALLASGKGHTEEKAVAVATLTELAAGADPIKIRSLVNSKRAGFRQLACQIVAQHGAWEDAQRLFPLLNDHNAEVRRAAVQAISSVASAEDRQAEAAKRLRSLLNDADPEVSLHVAWMLMPVDAAAGLPTLQRWLQDSAQPTRLLAAAALGATGQYGQSAMLRELQTHTDPYVRLNIALNLICLREHVDAACHQLRAGLTKIPDRWMWEEQGIFRFIAPSDVAPKEGVPNYPEAVNQMVRLEVLNALAIANSPEALEAIKQFLQERSWGITGVAASLLLSEGDTEALALIRTLLNDPTKRVRVQAALALALWGRDPQAVDCLQQAYKDADFSLKGMIIEALGNIEHEGSIPFLLQALQEPSEQLRLIVASSLLRCLNS